MVIPSQLKKMSRLLSPDQNAKCYRNNQKGITLLCTRLNLRNKLVSNIVVVSSFCLEFLFVMNKMADGKLTIKFAFTKVRFSPQQRPSLYG